MKMYIKVVPLSNFEILEKCRELKIKHFKGVFMRDELNKNNEVTKNECLVLNIDESSNNGTHWVCMFIKNNVCYYFDSYGFLPPKEVKQYCSRMDDRYYNTFVIQNPDQVICGHFCIYVLYKLSNDIDFYNVLNELYYYNNKYYTV